MFMVNWIWSITLTRSIIVKFSFLTMVLNRKICWNVWFCQNFFFSLQKSEIYVYVLKLLPPLDLVMLLLSSTCLLWLSMWGNSTFVISTENILKCNLFVFWLFANCDIHPFLAAIHHKLLRQVRLIQWLKGWSCWRGMEVWVWTAVVVVVVGNTKIIIIYTF